MKKAIKFLASSFGVATLLILIAVMINSTDEQQTPRTQELLQKFPAREGFLLKDFKLPREERTPTMDFTKYSDYLKEQAKYDDLIAKYTKNLALMEKAVSIGHVAVNPDDTFKDGVSFFPRDEHRLFLAYISQKIKQGKTNEALKLLEQSNRFLVSIAESPQTIIAKLIAIAILKNNADFAQDLVATGVIKKAPASLKESFQITQTSDQLWDESSRKEFQLSSTLILSRLDRSTAESLDVFIDGPSIADKTIKPIFLWLYPKLFRPNHTLNMLSKGYADIASPVCQKSSSKECEQLYAEATANTATNFFLNPVGRYIVKILLPRFQGVKMKFEYGTTKLRETVATL